MQCDATGECDSIRHAHLHCLHSICHAHLHSLLPCNHLVRGGWRGGERDKEKETKREREKKRDIEKERDREKERERERKREKKRQGGNRVDLRATDFRVASKYAIDPLPPFPWYLANPHCERVWSVGQDGIARAVSHSKGSWVSITREHAGRGCWRARECVYVSGMTRKAALLVAYECLLVAYACLLVAYARTRRG